MSLRNPKLFGLEVNNQFADVLDKDAALKTINLPPRDLDVIRFSSDVVSQTDFVTCSGLSVPVYKTLDRLYRDSLQYNEVLDTSAGFDRILFGNLNVNGKVSASSIRYRFVNGTGPSSTIKFADISTSRASSWNSTDSPPLSTSAIFYGAKVGIITSGQLGFSGSVGGNRLKTTIVPEKKEFAAEFVTHKILCQIGGSQVTLFAMKGIPLTFKGFFRDLDATITRINIGNIRPTWRIQEVNNLSQKTDFVNRNSTSISYRGTIGAERFVKYYYNPNNVTTVKIRNSGITEIPKSTLNNLTDLDLSRNKLEIFPNLKNLTPNLTTLNLEDNPFHTSEISDERNLNQKIVDKLPQSLLNLTLGRTFGGSIQQNLLSGNNFPNLLSLDLVGPNNPVNVAVKFTKDLLQDPCELPNVGDTVVTYSMNGNRFETFGTTDASNNAYNCQDLPNLESLSLFNNPGLTDSNFTVSSSKIRSITTGRTRLPIPDLRNKLELETYQNRDSRSSVGVGMSIYASDGEFKFKSCPKLRNLTLRSGATNGEAPILDNPELTFLDFRFTRIKGQSGPNCLAANTLTLAEKIQYFLIDSRYWEVTTPINGDIFSNSNSLFYWWFRTYGKTTGPLPLFTGCPNLRYILALSNAFTGNLPNFQTTPLIYYINLSNNNFSGNIPPLTNLTNLRFLFLQSNRFTSLGTFSNLSTLEFFYAYSNNLSGSIPDFSGCPKIKRIYLYNNQLNDYNNGSLNTNTNLRVLYLQNNNLSQSSINKIIEDLFTNFENFERSGVIVNLTNNTAPGGNDEVLEKLDYLRREAKWSISTD